MASHPSLVNFEITDESPSTGWGIIDLTKHGEFMLRTEELIYDLHSDWSVTTSGAPKEGLKVLGTINVDIDNFNGYIVTVFGVDLNADRLANELKVELIYDEDLNPIVIFSDDYTPLNEEDPIAMAAIGDREYTEENSITSGETITASLDSLDVEKAPILNPVFTENITVNNTIKINPAEYTDSIEAGEIRWDILDDLDNLDDDYETINHLLGLGLLYKIQNFSGNDISRGELLMQSGAIGAVHQLKGAKVDADTGAFSRNILGLSSNTIVNGEDGYVTGFGLIKGIDTSEFSIGDRVWHDPDNPGKLTNVMPEAPNPKVFIGTVINKHATYGSIFVRISYGIQSYELNDVKTFDPDTLPDKQALAWDAANKRWQPLDVETLIGFGINLTEGHVPYFTSDSLEDSPITSDGTDISISGDVNMTKSIKFSNITPITDIVTGEFRWNATEGTAELGMGFDGVSQQIGLELYYKIKNLSAVTISDGKLVMLDGTLGSSGILKGRLSDSGANTFPRAIMGLATMNVGNGTDGFVTQFGLVRGIDTTMWEEGDILWYDPTSSGGLTNVMPEAPNAKVVIAVVITKHAHNGSVFVRPSYGLKLSEIHDVKTYDPDTLERGTILSWDSVNKRWDKMTAFYDSTGSPGATSQVLFSTTTGTRWGYIGDALTFTKTNLGVGSHTLGSFNRGIAYGAYIDYVILTVTNIPIKVGTLYTVWSSTDTEFMNYSTKDLTFSTDTVALSTVVSGSLLMISAVISAGVFNIKISIRLI